MQGIGAGTPLKLLAGTVLHRSTQKSLCDFILYSFLAFLVEKPHKSEVQDGCACLTTLSLPAVLIIISHLRWV